MPKRGSDSDQNESDSKHKSRQKREKFPQERTDRDYRERSKKDIPVRKLTVEDGDADLRTVLDASNVDQEEVSDTDKDNSMTLRSGKNLTNVNENAKPGNSKPFNPAVRVVKPVKSRSNSTQTDFQTVNPQQLGIQLNMNDKGKDPDKNSEKINDKPDLTLQTGDGINVEVTPHDEDSSTAEGSSEDSSSSSGSESEMSSSSSEAPEEETPPPVYERGRKKKRVEGKRDKRERNDRAEEKYHRKLLKENPALMAYVQQKVAKKRKASSPTKTTQKKSKSKPSADGNLSKKVEQTPTRKSRSDLTMYVPVLEKNVNSPEVVGKMANTGNVVDPEVLNQYLRDIRLSTTYTPKTGISESARKRKDRTPPEQESSDSEEDGEPTAREFADQAILRAEEFKASLAAPKKGNLFNKGLTRGHDDDEDDFFSMTCHVSKELRERIAKCDYIELEKLLPKPFKPGRQQEDFRMNISSKDGMNFWVPAPEKENKITGIKKWDQAFRIYASIFTQYNPERGPEIMQYIHTINSAAQNYAWENVAEYDYIFRQKMAQKPYKSWAKAYLQVWTMKMVNPINKFQQHSFSSGSTSTQQKKDWREVSCWRYNRNKCTKPPGTCRFEHRCSYCGSFNHIYPGCPKRPKKNVNKQGGEDQTKRVVGGDTAQSKKD